MPQRSHANDPHLAVTPERPNRGHGGVRAAGAEEGPRGPKKQPPPKDISEATGEEQLMDDG